MDHATLKYPEIAYTPIGIEFGHITEKEARKEYSRLRAISMKRLQRLERFRKSTADWVAYEKQRLITLSEADAARVSVSTLLTEARLFVTNPLSTIKGQREKTKSRIVETLQAHNYNISAEELTQFGKFMDWAKSKLLDAMISSDQVAQLYEDARDIGINSAELQRDFDVWLSRRYEVHKAAQKGMSAKEVRELLGLEEDRPSKTSRQGPKSARKT